MLHCVNSIPNSTAFNEWYYVRLPQVWRTPAGLRSRLLQCWVKTPGNITPPAGVTFKQGFTAREWQDRKAFRWMNEAELRDFCDRLQELRGLLEALVTKVR